MRKQDLKDFFYYLSYGEHLGDQFEFNNLLFSITATNPHSNNFVEGQLYNDHLDAIIEKLPNDTNWPDLCLHHVIQRLKARSLTRTNDDVEAIRAIVVDIDHELTGEQLREILKTTKPAIIVASSKNKFHFYWPVKPGKFTPEQYREIAAKAALYLGGDKALKSPCHTLRTPGFKRFTKSGKVFTPTFKVFPNNLFKFKLSNLESLKEKYQLPESEQDKPLWHDIPLLKVKRGGKFEEAPEEEIISYLKRNAKKEGRNNILCKVINGVMDYQLHHLASMDENEIVDLVETTCRKYNEFLEKPLDEKELKDIIGSRKKHTKELVRIFIFNNKRAVEVLTKVTEETKVKKKVYEITLGRIIDDTSEEKVIKELADARYSDTFLANETYLAHPDKFFAFEKELYVFDGIYWQKQDEHFKLLRGMVENVVKNSLAENTFQLRISKVDQFGNITQGIDQKKAQQEYDKLLSHGKNTAIIKTLITSSMLPVKSIFDLNPEDSVIADEKGIIVSLTEDWSRPAKPEDFIINSIATHYDPDARCPAFVKWLKEIYANNDYPESAVKSFQNILGYTLSGNNRESKIFCHIGEGANGKSLIIKLIKLLAGTYGDSFSGEYLVTSPRSTAYRPSLERVMVKLQNKRVMVVDDLKGKNYVWNEEIVKAITSDVLSIKELYEESRTIPNKVTMHVALNEFPSFESDNFAMRRRFVAFKYNREFLIDADKEQEIIKMFHRELPGIFNWVVEGTRAWYKTGLDVNKEMNQELETIYEAKLDLSEKDAFNEVFESGDELDPPIATKELYNYFRNYFKDRDPATANIDLNAFGRRLGDYFKGKKSEKLNKFKCSQWYIRVKDPLTREEKDMLI